jgi:hypothetical protein
VARFVAAGAALAATSQHASEPTLSTAPADFTYEKPNIRPLIAPQSPPSHSFLNKESIYN